MFRPLVTTEYSGEKNFTYIILLILLLIFRIFPLFSNFDYFLQIHGERCLAYRLLLRGPQALRTLVQFLLTMHSPYTHDIRNRGAKFVMILSATLYCIFLPGVAKGCSLLVRRFGCLIALLEARRYTKKGKGPVL